MNALINKYSSILSNLIIEGKYARIGLIILIFPACFRAFFIIKSKFSELSYFYIFSIVLVLGILMVLLILTIKPIHFVNSIKVNRNNRIFKIEIFEKLKMEIPELKFHQSIQKIHPLIFEKSNLYNEKYDDFVGDDFMVGEYKNIAFKMCELHVFKLFKNIFRGYFNYIDFEQPIKNPSVNLQKIKSTNSYIQLSNRYEINLNITENYFFLGIQNNQLFFENSTFKLLDKVDDDAQFLKEVVGLLKETIDIIVIDEP